MSMIPRTTHPGGNKFILGVLAVFVALAAFYSMAIPVAEAVDEVEHVGYTLFIRDHKKLPVANIEGDNASMSIVIHPPLYYALAAPLVAGIDTSDFDHVVKFNPRFSFKDAIPNVFLHFGQEKFPYKGTVLAFHILRLWSIVLGIITLYAIYHIALYLWPNSPGAAELTAVIFAFNPSFVFMASTVHNDVAITALYTLGTWWAVALLDRERPSLAFEGLGGILLGLTALAKISGLGLAGIYAIAIALRAWRQRSWGQFIRPLLITLLLGGIIAGWWYVRNWQLYGDPLAWHLNQIRFKQMVRTQPYSWLDLLQFLRQIGSTFWGAFGYTQLKTSYLIYAMLWGLLLAAGIGLNLAQVGRITANRARRFILSIALAFLPLLIIAFTFVALYQSPYQPAVFPVSWQTITSLAVVGTVAAWLLALVLALFRLARPELLKSLAQDKALQRALILVTSLLILVVALFRYSLGFGAIGFGRLLFPAATAIAWLTLMGWQALVRQRGLPWLAGGVGIGLLVYSIACIPWIVWPSYRVPAPANEEEWQAARPVNATFDESLKLVAAEITPSIISPGRQGEATLHLYWQSVTRERWDVLAHVRLTDPAGQDIVDITYWPVDARFPPSVWEGDVTYADHLPMIIPANAYTGRYQATVRLISRGSTDSLPAVDAQGESVSPVINVGELLVATQVQAVTEQEIPNPLDAQLGQHIRLRGYSLDIQQAESGQAVQVTLYWQASELIPRDYTVFVQILDESGVLVAQKDNQPVEGKYPTSVWQVGAIIPDTYIIPIPSQIQTGDYRLITGMYLYPSLERLPVTQNGRPGKDFVDVTVISSP
jgi:4-amino-4-deoxy-L-arabinose transferase-like glycosyltransferase